MVVAGGGPAPTTVTLAEAIPPAPPSTEVTAPVVLFLVPAVVPVTFALKVHEALAASVALARLMAPDPATAVIVPPPQLPMSPFGVETTRPAGNVSVKPTPVNVDALGLLMVKLSEVDAFSAMLAAPKAFTIVGGAMAAPVVMRPIWLPLDSVNQRLPSGPAAIPKGSPLAVGIANSVMTPAVVIRPILEEERPERRSVNQRLPSGPTAIASIWALAVGTANSVMTPAVVIRPILLPLYSVNQRAPSGPAVIP